MGGITDSVDMSLSKLWETVKDRGAWRAVVHGVAKNQTRLSDCTTTTTMVNLREKARKRDPNLTTESFIQKQHLKFQVTLHGVQHSLVTSGIDINKAKNLHH